MTNAPFVELSEDHPGFSDPKYRARRDAIAAAAMHREPRDIAYEEAETDVWRTVRAALDPLHERFACTRIREANRRLELPRDRIPQLREVDRALRGRTGFRMMPVAGLVSPREFLSALAGRVFLSTQYVRHASRPFYTPEPDVVHELVGHAASLADPAIAELSSAFGEAALDASDETIAVLDRLYWFTLEFGLVREGGEPKALGAGLLSSAAEIERACAGGRVTLVDFDVERVAATSFSTDSFQDVLFVAPSFDSLKRDLATFLSSSTELRPHAGRPRRDARRSDSPRRAAR